MSVTEMSVTKVSFTKMSWIRFLHVSFGLDIKYSYKELYEFKNNIFKIFEVISY